MGPIVAITAGLVVWVVLWALGAKGFDAFLLTMTIAVLAVMGQTLFRNAPGRDKP